jgi:hypothetical protein
MRRVIAGVLVLLFASLAQGGLVFIVDGEPQPTDILLYPGEVVELGLELESGQNIFSYNLDYILSSDGVCFITDGASGSYPDLPPMTDIEFPTVFDWPGMITINETQQVRIQAGQLLTPALNGPLVLMDELYMYCSEPFAEIMLTITNAGGTIINGETVPPDTVMHTLTIHGIIPEPMTIALLGLGGLFVLSRRKR